MHRPNQLKTKENTPMKSLLRTLILAVLVFAGYSAFSIDNTTTQQNHGPMTPTCAPCTAK
jgi:hypothetical protein